MTEEYIRTLRQQLKGFSADEQNELIDEINSHIESGEEDSKIGKDSEHRREKMIHELGSPKDMGRNFQELYRPNRFIDYLLILLPYFLYPYLNTLYSTLMPRYSWADIRLDILIHLPLVAVGLWRRSAPLTLFWATILISQLFIITVQMDLYYGIQTAFWAFLLLTLLALAGSLIWKHKNDLLIVIFGLVPLSMCILGNILSTLHIADYSFGPIGQSLLLIYSSVNSVIFYIMMLAMAAYFLAASRQFRWLALMLYSLAIGVSQSYLNNVFSEQIYMLWIVLPLTLVILGWYLEQNNRKRLTEALS